MEQKWDSRETGSVSVNVEKNTKGHNWELRIELPVDKDSDYGATFQKAIDHIDNANAELKRRFGTVD